MYIYDRANALADDMKKSAEYVQYKAAKDEVYADATSKDLIKQYKKLQFEAQAMLMSGKQPDTETMDKLKKLGEVLAFNPKVGEFFAAEYKFQTLIQYIYKIIGEASEIMTDFLSE